MTIPDCRDCHNCAVDPDGLYCASKEAREVSCGFGLNLSAARSDRFDCGPSGKLFEIAPEAILKARGRSKVLP